MKKVLILLILTLTLTGCGGFLDVSPEQHAQIVEYSAGLLLKYDRFYEHNLVTIALPTPAPSPTPEPVTPPDDDMESSGENRNQPEIIDKSIPLDLTEIIGINGLAFNYAGALVTDRYPNEAAPEEIYLYIDALPDSKLLVVRFNVVNSTSSDIYLDMNEFNLRIRIGYNGGNISSTLFTMLLNDLSWYNGMIPAGESIELASLCNTELTDVSEIDSLEFFVRSGSDNFSFSY